MTEIFICLEDCPRLEDAAASSQRTGGLTGS